MATAVGLLSYFTQSEVALAFLAAGFLVILARVGPASIVRWLGGRRPGALAAVGVLGPLLPSATTDPGLLATLAVFFLKPAPLCLARAWPSFPSCIRAWWSSTAG